MALLEVRNLSVVFKTLSGTFKAVDGVDLSVDNSEIYAIVGESGSGKSVLMLAIMGLLPWTASISADKMVFDGQDLQKLSAKERRKIIGKNIAMIFQDPVSSLNPCFTVGFQVREALRQHLRLSHAQAQQQALQLFEMVGIADPQTRLQAFPHQMSGGMSQRVMIAMALACRPKLLIADEPTTALDVTIQAQILDLLCDLHKQTGMALVLITHDMGVVAETANRVSVQYAGQKVEEQSVAGLFARPQHPYTVALLKALPGRTSGRHLPTIPGTVPGQFDRPKGCLFAPRCVFAQQRCQQQVPQPASLELGLARCHFAGQTMEVRP